MSDPFREYFEVQRRLQAFADDQMAAITRAAELNQRIILSLPATLDPLGGYTAETLAKLANLSTVTMSLTQPSAASLMQPSLDAMAKTVWLGDALPEIHKLGDAWARYQVGQVQALVDRFAETSRLMRSVDLTAITHSLTNYIANLPPVEWLIAQELDSRGWWLVPTWDDATLDEVRAHLGKPGTKRELTSWLIAHYRWNRARRLGRMVSGWDLREFGENGRPELFAQALSAFRANHYAVVLHALNGVFEGIVKDFLFSEGLIDERTRRGKTSPIKLFDKHLKTRRAYLDGYAAQLKRDFAWYADPDGKKRRVNRHAQAHGREAAPNSAAEAVRAFLLLETLHFHLSRARTLSKKKSA